MMPQYPETDNGLPHNPACASSLSKGGVVISLRNSAITKEIEIMSAVPGEPLKQVLACSALWASEYMLG